MQLERRAERARAAVRGVDQVGAPRELVAQAHRFLGPRARVQALDREATDEPADDQREQHFEPDVERHEVPAEGLVEVMRVQPLEDEHHRRRCRRDEQAADGREADAAGDQRKEQRLGRQRSALEAVRDHVRRDDRGVEHLARHADRQRRA